MLKFFEAQNAMNQLNVSTGAGLGGIETMFIKLASHTLTNLLADLFNLSLSTGELPATWKCANITSLRKGKALVPSNYPIDLYRTRNQLYALFSNLVEKLIYIQLSYYLSVVLTTLYHHFSVASGLTTPKLLPHLNLTNNVFSAADNGEPTRAVFMDLSNAFDFVGC